MNSLLLVIDLQRSFINDNTKFLIDKINVLLNGNKFDNVVFTRFINSLDSILYKKLNYKGCLSEEDREIVLSTNSNKIIDKKIYSSLCDDLKLFINNNNISKIYLCGIDTECCVLKTALDLFESGYDVYVLKDYCACMNGIERHRNALDILRINIGFDKII